MKATPIHPLSVARAVATETAPADAFGWADCTAPYNS